MQIRFKPEAETELAEARLWYSLQREGLDAALMNRIDQTLSAIAARPHSYPIVYRNLRRAVVRHFPLRFFMNRVRVRSSCLRCITQDVILNNLQSRF